jgi:hypothetical protein
MSDFGETTYPVARKQHRCIWCLGPISKGEKHSRWKGMFDGEWQDNRMHMECAADLAKDNYGADGFMPGEGEMPDRIKALSPGRGVAGEGEHK